MVLCIHMSDVTGLLTGLLQAFDGAPQEYERWERALLLKGSLNFPRQGFLFYHEKRDIHGHLYIGGAYGCEFSDSLKRLPNWTFHRSSSNHDSSRTILIKQTYTVFVDTPAGHHCKWHLSTQLGSSNVHRLIVSCSCIFHRRVP
jgi:hypothetical protein